MSSPFVWFMLLDSTTGEAYKGTSADKVAVSFPADVADFRKAVKAELADSHLKGIAPLDLKVYKNKAAFIEGHEKPLKSSCLMDGLGKTEEEEDMLVVVVPSSRSPSRHSSEVSLPRKEPKPAQLALQLPVSVDRRFFLRHHQQEEEDMFASMNENDTTLDPGCSLSALGSLGSNSRQPLIIKPKNDISSPTTSDSSRSSINKEVIQIDSIDIHTEHLKRPELLAKLTHLAAQNRFVRLTSPAASGKSSLLMLFKHWLKKRADVVWISCLDDRTCSELLREKAGINLQNGTTVDGVGKKDLIVFLDDAQAKYADLTFWKVLVKMSPNWLPQNVRFVISSTHLLAGGIESPLELRSLPSLERCDFLLSADEANQFLDFEFIGLPKAMRFPTLKTLLINECGGLIGALRLSVDSLKSRFSKDVNPPELALLQHLMSNSYVSNMDRCFGSAHSVPIGDDYKHFLKRVFVDEVVMPQCLINPKDEESYVSLQKAGILVETSESTFMFSSPLAKRYYSKWIFRDRSSDAPASLHELVRNVITSMSSNQLTRSTVKGDFPKEAVFQHLFMYGLARFTKPSCSICPELSKVFPSDLVPRGSSGAVAGEIDFYLNGDLRWGIELLVNGDRISEHLSRFSPAGKYAPLCMNDFAVVDIRRNNSGQPLNITKHEKRITVVFKDGDFTRAQCLFGLDGTAVSLQLAD